MDDASHRLQEKLSRRVFLGHRGIVIIGQGLAKHGIQNILDELSRSPDSRLKSFVLTARNETAKKILSAPYPLEKVPEEGVRELEESGVGLATSLNQFLDASASLGKAPVTATIETKNNDYLLMGAAAYKHDKLSGFFSEKEARGILWVIGKVRRANIITSIPKQSGMISTELLRGSSSIKPTLKHGKLQIFVNIKVVGRISENNTKLDLSNPEILENVQKYIGKDIQKRVHNTVQHSQKDLKSDVFGFGEDVHVKYPTYWKKISKKWEKIYPEVPVIVTAQASILRVGRSGAPVHLQEQEIQK